MCAGRAESRRRLAAVMRRNPRSGTAVAVADSRTWARILLRGRRKATDGVRGCMRPDNLLVSSWSIEGSSGRPVAKDGFLFLVLVVENGSDVDGVCMRFCQRPDACKETSEKAGKKLMERSNYWFLGPGEEQPLHSFDCSSFRR